MNIGKAAPPQTLPISASISLSKLPADHNALTAWCETLDAHGLLKNAVGISMQTLYLTAHLGSEDIIKQLTAYGFNIERHQVCVYVLSKNHDTTTITAQSLSDELRTMLAASQSALAVYHAKTDMASLPGVLDDKLSMHLMRLIVPAHTLSLALVFPMGVSQNRLSFDNLFLGSYARGRHLHQRSLEPYLQQEFGYLNDVVAAVFPDSAPAFKIWTAAYIHYLMEYVKQPGVADDIVAKVSSAIAPRKEDPTAPASPAPDTKPSGDTVAAAPEASTAPAAQPETLKEKMTRLRTEEGIPPEDGPLTAVDVETSSNGVILVRPTQPPIIRAWRIPHPGVMRGDMISVPYWAFRCTSWDFTTDHGKWLVFDANGAKLMTNEQFEEVFEPIVP